jgi:NAD(P)-dependent dehydrogenase (short-subunit alcohol dehydrogenase family)
MDLNLSGRTVLVTGSSKGIGLGIAQRFAAEGCHLWLAARAAERLETAAAVIRQAHPVQVRTMAVDLAEPAARAKLVEACPDIDILVNNAGAIPGGAIEEVDDRAWRTGWDLKVFGYIDLCRAYLARMRTRRRGVIVNVIGLAGERVDFNYVAGSMGNASLMAMTRALGGTSPDFGVRVVGVNPGPVDTDRIVYLAKKRAVSLFGDENRWREAFAKMPFGRPASVDEIAAMVVFLASDLSSYTSGTVVTIDGGIASRGASTG